MHVIGKFKNIISNLDQIIAVYNGKMCNKYIFIENTVKQETSK